MIDLAGTMYRREEDVVAVTHCPKSTGDAVEEARPTAQVIDVGPGHLVVGLDENLLVAECRQCGLHRQENSGELSCIARLALLLREPEAASFVAKCAGVAEVSSPPAPAVAGSIRRHDHL